MFGNMQLDLRGPLFSPCKKFSLFDFQAGRPVARSQLSGSKSESKQPAPSRQLASGLFEVSRAHTRPLATAGVLPAFGSEDHQQPTQPPLSAWQKEKLRQVSSLGRRNVPVNTLSKELGLERQQVLQWLKQPELLFTERSAALLHT